jgi:hypothetical protein
LYDQEDPATVAKTIEAIARRRFAMLAPTDKSRPNAGL